MAHEFELQCPGPHIYATWGIVSPLATSDLLTISSLTGCMGLICVVPNVAALLVHDTQNGYPAAKAKFSEFMNTHAASAGNVRIVFAGVQKLNQIRYFGFQGVDPANCRFVVQPKNNTLKFPEDHGGGSSKVTLGKVIDDSNFTLTVHQLGTLKAGDTLWKEDKTTNACPSCGKKFGFFVRRHHCRNCGGIFCAECTAKAPIGNAISGDNVPKLLYCYRCIARTPFNMWANY